jgi:hypothetical protein
VTALALLLLAPAARPWTPAELAHLSPARALAALEAEAVSVHGLKGLPWIDQQADWFDLVAVYLADVRRFHPCGAAPTEPHWNAYRAATRPWFRDLLHAGEPLARLRKRLADMAAREKASHEGRELYGPPD